jgi:MFS family permease
VSAPATPTPSARTYVLVMVTLVYVVNYLDRQILGILLPQIQKEFLLNDTQLGLVSGTAFAVIYATLGIPVSTLADRMSRRNIIAASLAMFSLMTVLSGTVTRFWQLLLTRFGTGIGEAGTGPSINSMLADLYPPEKRAGALAFYSAGLNVGLLIGFFGGGWIAQHYGWRPAFLASGAPGLLLVFVFLFTVKEPVRGQADHLIDKGVTPGLLETIAFLWQRPTFLWIALGCAMSAFGGYAGLAFIPKFLIVSHHLTIVQTATVLALLTGVLGAVGTYFSGRISDALGRRDVRWNMYVPMWAAIIAVPFAPVFYLSSSTTVALAGATGPSLMGAAYLGASYAMTQAMVPLRMRAQAIAILLFTLNMIALGLGPLTVGAISDWLRPTFGADSLRYALMSSVVTGLLAAFCYWRGSKTLQQDLSHAVGD